MMSLPRGVSPKNLTVFDCTLQSCPTALTFLTAFGSLVCVPVEIAAALGVTQQSGQAKLAGKTTWLLSDIEALDRVLPPERRLIGWPSPEEYAEWLVAQSRAVHRSRSPYVDLSSLPAGYYLDNRNAVRAGEDTLAKRRAIVLEGIEEDLDAAAITAKVKVSGHDYRGVRQAVVADIRYLLSCGWSMS
jgi:hypothetical protein